MRLAKYIAHSGYCPRRAAGDLVNQRKVSIGGNTITDQSYEVLPGDQVRIGNLVIRPPGPTEVWLYHKPPGCLTTHNDPLGRAKIFDFLPERIRSMKFIGRLDYNSDGLVLLTSNGDLANHLSSPKNKIERKYIARTFGFIHETSLMRMKGRNKIGGMWYNVSNIRIIEKNGNNWVLEFTLQEGKNREIRNILDHLDMKVKKLTRTAFGNFSIARMPPGTLKKASNTLINRYLKEMEDGEESIANTTI